MGANSIKVKLVKSTIRCPGKQKKIVAALGLRRLNQEKLMPDNDAVRGMIFKVKHLLEVS